MCDRTSSNRKSNRNYCSHGHLGNIRQEHRKRRNTATDRRLHVNISHNTSHQTARKHRYNGVRSRLRQWTSDVPDTPAHTTLGLVYTRTLRNHIRRTTTIDCVPVAGMARAKSLVDVASDQPKTNINLRHVSKMVNNVQQRTTKTLMLQNIASRESQMFQRIESETWPFKQRRTWTTCDQRGGCNHRERMLKLSLSSVAAPHRPRPCPTEIRRTETHPSTRTEKKNAAGIIRCIIIPNKITTT